MMQKITTTNAPAAIGPYAQAIQLGNVVYTSGQIPLNLAGESVEGGIAEQTHQVFRNLEAVLEQAGTSLQHVVKTTVFMQDLAQFAEMNAIYAHYFAEHTPARSTVQVAGLPRQSLIEIEVIALIP